MKPSILFGGGLNTYYMNWKEDKDYEGHIKRLKNINDKQVDVSRKYQNLDKLIDYSHKKREIVKDFNRKEFSFNLGYENNRIKKRLEEISGNQSKDSRHAHDHIKFSQTLYNNNKVITQRQKQEQNKQLEHENLQLASRILNLRSSYQSEEHNSHFQVHQQYKKNAQKFRKRDRSLVLNVNCNHLDEYSPNNSIFELVRHTATNSTHISQNNSPPRINFTNNNSIVFNSSQQSPIKQSRENKHYPQIINRPKSINNNTTPMKALNLQGSIDYISEPSKDFIAAERSIDSTTTGERRNRQRVKSNLSVASSPSNKFANLDENTKKGMLGGRDIFLTVAIKKITFKTFIPSESDEDLYYFIINAEENKPNRTQLKLFKKISSSSYHLAFISNKFKNDDQKVIFQLWQNKKNNDIFQGEFIIDISKLMDNQEFDLELKKIVPRTSVVGRVLCSISIHRINTSQNNEEDKPSSEQTIGLDLSGAQQNNNKQLENNDKQRSKNISSIPNNKQPPHSSLK